MGLNVGFDVGLNVGLNVGDSDGAKLLVGESDGTDDG